MDKKLFFDQIVFGWIKKDIERITSELPARSGQMGNVNFPLALCVLEYMQYLGTFLLGVDHNNTTQNMTEYIKNCMPHAVEYQPDILVDIFRNGLSHDYFARGAISRAGLRPALFKATIGPVLDVETLSRDFVNSLTTFEAKLDETHFQSRMKQLMDAIVKFQTKHQTIIDALPTEQVLLPQVSTSSRALAAGASGLAGPVSFTNSSEINHLGTNTSTTSGIT